MGQEGIAGEEKGQLGLLGWLVWACLHAEQDLRGKGLALDVLCRGHVGCMVRMGERKQQKEQDSKQALGVRTNLAGQAGGPKVQAHCVGSAVPGPNVACAGL